MPIFQPFLPCSIPYFKTLAFEVNRLESNLIFNSKVSIRSIWGITPNALPVKPSAIETSDKQKNLISIGFKGMLAAAFY